MILSKLFVGDVVTVMMIIYNQDGGISSAPADYDFSRDYSNM